MIWGKHLSFDTKNKFISSFVLLGFAQGFVLYFYNILGPGSNGSGIFNSVAQFDGLTLGIISAGLVFFLVYSEEVRRRTLVVSGLFGLIICVLVETSALALGHKFETMSYLAWLVINYVSLPFLQLYIQQRPWPISYKELYFHAWNNAQVVASSYLLTGAFFLIFALAGWLFTIIKVRFFLDLLRESLFLLPAYFTVKAIGYAVARENSAMVDATRKLTIGFCALLAPILACFSLIFVGLLPLTGLEPVWSTKNATTIFLACALALILMFNAVFQDGTENRHFRNFNGKILQFSLPIVAIFGALAVYSTGLRISQYGLMPERVFALLASLVTTLYGMGYTVAAIQSSRSVPIIQTVNISMAFVVVTLAVLIQLPKINPISLSAWHQYKMIADGSKSLNLGDLWLLNNKLGDAGKNYFAKLKTLTGHPEQTVLTEAIKQAEASKYDLRWERASDTDTTDPIILDEQLRDLSSYTVLRLTNGQLPEEFLDVFITENAKELRNCYRKSSKKENGERCALIEADVTKDQINDYVFLKSDLYSADLFLKNAEGVWSKTIVSARVDINVPFKERLSYVQSEPVSVKPPQQDFDELQIGDQLTVKFE